jgi:hypothetical protein
MEEIEKMLATRRWAKDCLRVNITEPEDIIQRGNIRISKLQSEVLPKKEVVRREAIQAIAPELWGDETQVLVNRIFFPSRRHGPRVGSADPCAQVRITGATHTVRGILSRPAGLPARGIPPRVGRRVRHDRHTCASHESSGLSGEFRVGITLQDFERVPIHKRRLRNEGKGVRKATATGAGGSTHPPEGGGPP